MVSLDNAACERLLQDAPIRGKIRDASRNFFRYL